MDTPQSADAPALPIPTRRDVRAFVEKQRRELDAVAAVGGNVGHRSLEHQDAIQAYGRALQAQCGPEVAADFYQLFSEESRAMAEHLALTPPPGAPEAPGAPEEAEGTKAVLTILAALAGFAGLAYILFG